MLALVPMAAESDLEREERAHDLAYQKGRRDAVVDVQLSSHAQRLDVINGSIERSAKANGALKDEIREWRKEQDEKVDSIITTLAAKEAVEKDRVKAIKTANDQQISKRNFWVGVAAVCAALSTSPIILILLGIHS